MNPENLKPNSERTPSERKKLASKAGRASGESRRRKKTFKELLEVALSMPSVEGNTNAEQIVIGMIEAAQSGDTKAFIAIRDTIGEKPVDRDDKDETIGALAGALLGIINADK